MPGESTKEAAAVDAQSVIAEYRAIDVDQQRRDLIGPRKFVADRRLDAEISAAWHGARGDVPGEDGVWREAGTGRVVEEQNPMIATNGDVTGPLNALRLAGEAPSSGKVPVVIANSNGELYVHATLFRHALRGILERDGASIDEEIGMAQILAAEVAG